MHVSIAHTDCTLYEEAGAVFDAGASHLTHLYNAMPGIIIASPVPSARAASVKMSSRS